MCCMQRLFYGVGMFQPFVRFFHRAGQSLSPRPAQQPGQQGRTLHDVIF